MEFPSNKLLIDDHREVDEILLRLFETFDEGDEAQVREQLDYFWARLAMHIRAENVHLFPAAVQYFRDQLGDDDPKLQAMEDAIAQLRKDHNFFMKELGAGIKELSDMANDREANKGKRLAELRLRVERVSDRLKQHNKIEETGVYLWGESLDDIGLRTKIRRELQNLPPRFFGARNRDDDLNPNLLSKAETRPSEVRLRKTNTSDRDFCIQLYFLTKKAETELFGWTNEATISFLQMQFEARERAYRMQFPSLVDEIALEEGMPVGRVLTSQSEGELLLVDISVIPDRQRSGIGAGIIAHLQLRAIMAGQKIVLRVDKGNRPAYEFYRKLGFAVQDESQIQYSMIWNSQNV